MSSTFQYKAQRCILPAELKGFKKQLMTDFGKLLIIFGAILIAAGLVLLLLGRTHIPIGRLPGDIIYRGKHTTFYFPLATSILLSVILSLVFYVLGKWRH